jgi:M6 family metalloprotease-like protein
MKRIVPRILPWLLAFAAAAARGENVEYGPPFVIQGGFAAPAGLAVDPAHGRLLVADTGGHRFFVAPLDGITATPAWTEHGFVADRKAPEALNEPQAIAADGAGNAYVVDTFGNEVQLYRFDAATGGYVLDPAFAPNTHVAGFDIRLPRDIAVDAQGKVYLLDSGNDRVLVADGPDDDSWSVWHANPAWGNPYGLDVAADGTVFIADTQNHRIVAVAPDGAESSFGGYGIGNSLFRFPRDVAVGADGRIYVADTNNHRAAVFLADHTFYRNLGGGPLFGTIQKIAVDAGHHVFVLDSNARTVVAFLGPVAALPFDAYVRDYAGDTGKEPTGSKLALSSPDLLVRTESDLDVSQPGTTELELFAFEQPRFERDNYVYVAVRNRGTQPISGVTAKLYWADPGSALSFPADWHAAEFFRAYAGEQSFEAGNALSIPTIPPRHLVDGKEVDGVVVSGPLIWRPPAPKSVLAQDGALSLFVRLLHADDLTRPGSGMQQVADNNNVAVRPVVVTSGPFPVGVQDTLVVRVDYPDIPEPADAAVVAQRIQEVKEWISKVSYGLATIHEQLVADPVVLPQTREHYNQAANALLVEMTTDALAKLPAETFDRGTPDPGDDIDRVVLVVNDPTFAADWATTGHWPYEIGGTVRELSVSVQGPSNGTFAYAHGLLHQLGLRDLSVYPDVQADEELKTAVEGWDDMALPFNGAHPLAWSKQLATWVTSHDAKVQFIRRPTAKIEPVTLTLRPQTLAKPDETAAVAIGLSSTLTTLEEEKQFYWVEARDPVADPSDHAPEQGVLVYYVHKLVPQGEAPVIVRDPSPGTPRADAALAPGEEIEPPGTGIRIHVDSAAPSGGYVVTLDYDPPAQDFDVGLTPGKAEWESPDIWVDNPQDNGSESYDALALKSAGPVDESPIEKVENRIYARIWNHGPATAFDVKVRFRMSEPFHTIGGEADFSERAVRVIPAIPKDDFRDVFLTWKPQSLTDPHTCIRVEIDPHPDDRDPKNNQAQENVWIAESTTKSPYKEVKLDFRITNGEKTPRLAYFRVSGIPPAWQHAFADAKKLLAPGEAYVGSLKVKPNDSAAVCTDHEIQVTAWSPRGDTLVRLGGTTVNVELRHETTLSAEAGVAGCIAGDEGNSTPAFDTLKADFAVPPRSCALLTVKGCTDPVRAHETIVVRYSDPAGNPVYHEVMTDEFGCYEDFLVAVEGGDWEAAAHYPGNDCSGSASASAVLNLPIPQTGDQDGDGLPDSAEIDGDADGDGASNQLDKDSDNDGVLDGDEPAGDADQDGLENVIDPDSDNDGVIDGTDSEPYGPTGRELGWAVGWLDFADRLPVKDAKIFLLRMGVALPPAWSFEAELGVAPTQTKSGIDGTVWQGNANLLRHFAPFTALQLRPFLLFGLGALVFDGFGGDDIAAAAQLGVGVEWPFTGAWTFRGDLRLLPATPVLDHPATLNCEAAVGVTWHF